MRMRLLAPTFLFALVAPAFGYDSQSHADAVKLAEVSGTRQMLQERLKSMLGNAKAQITQQAPSCNTDFADEWAKRMSIRLKPDDFIAIVVTVFENHFSDAELKELITIRVAVNEKQSPIPPSAALKDKLDKEMPAIQSEIIGGSTQLGARIGGEVGQEIEKEHPTWCHHSASAKQ